MASVIQYPVFSSSVGMKKPDPNIFFFAAEKMSINPRECIFVDDSIEHLDGARKAGMTGVLIQDRTLNSSFSNPEESAGYRIASLREIGALIANVKLK